MVKTVLEYLEGIEEERIRVDKAEFLSVENTGADWFDLVASPRKCLYVCDMPRVHDYMCKNYPILYPKGILEIGITYRDKLQETFSPASLTAVVNKIMKRIVSRVSKEEHGKFVCSFIVGEYKTGRYHMHGILCGFPEVHINSIRRALTRYCGRTEIKEIKYFDSYISYMLKRYLQYQDVDITKERQYYQKEPTEKTTVSVITNMPLSAEEYLIRVDG